MEIEKDREGGRKEYVGLPVVGRGRERELGGGGCLVVRVGEGEGWGRERHHCTNWIICIKFSYFPWFPNMENSLHSLMT